MLLLYYLVLKPISMLPRKGLYAISNMLAVVLYRVVKYRRELVEKNLKLCFPDKDEEWINDQTRRFYTNLADVVVESIQAFSMDERDGNERIRITNPELFEERFNSGRSIIITGGHYVSWESMTFTANRLPHELIALYKPLKNKFMDNKVRASREKIGTRMIPMRDHRDYFIDLTDKPKAFVFGIDQSPRKGRGIWMEFLNRESLVYTGPERLAKEYDLDIAAGRMRRVSRGKYEVTFELLFDDPKSSPENEITTRTMKDIEDQVNEDPSGWLWSHNRWKHTREDGE